MSVEDTMDKTHGSDACSRRRSEAQGSGVVRLPVVMDFKRAKGLTKLSRRFASVRRVELWQ